MLRAILLALLLVPPTPTHIQAQAPEKRPYSNTLLGLSMSVPAGFFDEGADPLALNNVHCFVKMSDAESGWMRLCIDTLSAPLPQEKLHTRDLAPGAKVMPFTWKGFELQGVRADYDRDGAPVTRFVAMVPLRTRGVRLITEAPRADAARAQATLVSTLATVDGETNWLSRTERSERAGEKFGYIAGILIALGVGMKIARRRRER